ncbi:TPA: head-tail connector protein [Klebsiella variicola subsp. variicola]
MILTLDDVKTQLRLELDFTEHDAMLTQMVNAAQRSIERDYYCKLFTSDEELQALPETVRGFIADEDIRLAIQFLVSDAYLNGHTGQWLETAAVRHLLFPLQEHTL